MSKFAVGLVLLAIGGVAAAQNVVSLYSALRPIKDQGIGVYGWGSGRIAETTEISSEGAYSLRIQTNNFFQGGAIVFADPKDLTTAFNSPTRLLSLKFLVADASLTLGTQRPNAAPTAPATPSRVPLQNLRLIFSTSDGLKSEIYFPISAASGAKWKSVAFPLKGVTGFERTNKTVTQIHISGDATSTFYIAGLELVDDDVAITGELNTQRLDLALGDQVDLIAYGDGGATILKYEWDFDKSDGIQIEAEGQAVRRKFRKPGRFVVTCTISDQYGIKKPLVLELNVKVNE